MVTPSQAFPNMSWDTQAPDLVSNFSGIIRSRWGEEEMTFRIVFTGLVVTAAASLQAAAQTTQTRSRSPPRNTNSNPSTIKVKQGDHVRLVVTALDHDRGFKLEACNVDELLKKGEAICIEFSAIKPAHSHLNARISAASGTSE